MKTDRQPHASLAVFGLGEVGSILQSRAAQQGWQVDGFSRSLDPEAPGRFDAASEASVLQIQDRCPAEAYDVAVVTFPPQVACSRFWDFLETSARRRILLGTTGIYQRTGSGRNLITEATPLRPGHKRLALESEFLARGGVVFRLAGIYSSRRNPVRRLRQGRVGYEDRQLNLVHSRDAADALLLASTAPRLESIYNLADGQEHTWVQIIDFLVERGLVEHPRHPIPLTRPDSHVANRRFLSGFTQFRFRDFWSQLPALASSVQELAAD